MIHLISYFSCCRLTVQVCLCVWTIICGENVIWDVYKISCDIWRSSNTTVDTVHRNRNDVSRFPISTLPARQEFVVFRVRYVVPSIVHFTNTRFNYYTQIVLYTYATEYISNLKLNFVLSAWNECKWKFKDSFEACHFK